MPSTLWKLANVRRERFDSRHVTRRIPNKLDHHSWSNPPKKLAASPTRSSYGFYGARFVETGKHAFMATGWSARLRRQISDLPQRSRIVHMSTLSWTAEKRLRARLALSRLLVKGTLRASALMDGHGWLDALGEAAACGAASTVSSGAGSDGSLSALADTFAGQVQNPFNMHQLIPSVPERIINSAFALTLVHSSAQSCGDIDSSIWLRWCAVVDGSESFFFCGGRRQTKRDINGRIQEHRKRRLCPAWETGLRRKVLSPRVLMEAECMRRPHAHFIVPEGFLDWFGQFLHGPAALQEPFHTLFAPAVVSDRFPTAKIGAISTAASNLQPAWCFGSRLAAGNVHRMIGSSLVRSSAYCGKSDTSPAALPHITSHYMGEQLLAHLSRLARISKVSDVEEALQPNMRISASENAVQSR